MSFSEHHNDECCYPECCYSKCHFSEYRNDECCYSECCYSVCITLSVIIVNFVILCVIMMSVVNANS
jgi:hypothetical protein